MTSPEFPCASDALPRRDCSTVWDQYACAALIGEMASISLHDQPHLWRPKQAEHAAEMADALMAERHKRARPRVVCLCGSMRFFEEFRRQEYACELAGQIALLPAFSPNVAVHAHGGNVDITPAQKIACDELHRRKIDLADEVLVLNVGGYVGESTRGEIEYARAHGKPLRWLETPADQSNE